MEIYPCPRSTLKAYGAVESSRFREEVTKLGGVGGQKRTYRIYIYIYICIYIYISIYLVYVYLYTYIYIYIHV